MRNNTSITIRTDKEIKIEAQNILSSLGLDMNTAFNIFLRKIIQEEGLPFNVNLKTPKSITLKSLTETTNDKNLVGPFDTVNDLMNDLDA